MRRKKEILQAIELLSSATWKTKAPYINYCIKFFDKGKVYPSYLLNIYYMKGFNGIGFTLKEFIEMPDEMKVKILE